MFIQAYTPKLIRLDFLLAPKSQRTSATLAIIILAISLSFWGWIALQDQYHFGQVASAEAVGNHHAVAEIKVPWSADSSYILGEDLHFVNNQWMLLKSRALDSGIRELTHAVAFTEFYSGAKLKIGNPVNWALNSSYALLILAGILLLLPRTTLRWVYMAATSTALVVTMFYALHTAQWDGYITKLSATMLVISLAFTLIIGFRLSKTLSNYLFLESVTAMSIWYMVGDTLLSHFGFDSETLNLLVFLALLFAPGLLSGILSAYFLSKAFGVDEGTLQWLLIVVTGIASQLEDLPGSMNLLKVRAIDLIHEQLPSRIKRRRAQGKLPRGKLALTDIL